MKPYQIAVLLAAMTASAFAAETGSDAWGKAADNHIHAQEIVERVLRAHPDLMILALHATRPGTGDEMIIAANLDRIGKKDDDDDVSVAKEHRIVLAPNPTDPSKYEVLVPLRDAAGHFLGTIGTVFHYHAGDPEVGLLTRALKIRDEIATLVPDEASLFSTSEGQ